MPCSSCSTNPGILHRTPLPRPCTVSGQGNPCNILVIGSPVLHRRHLSTQNRPRPTPPRCILKSLPLPPFGKRSATRAIRCWILSCCRAWSGAVGRAGVALRGTRSALHRNVNVAKVFSQCGWLERLRLLSSKLAPPRCPTPALPLVRHRLHCWVFKR